MAMVVSSACMMVAIMTHMVRKARLLGVIGDATPGPVTGGVPMHGAGIAVLVQEFHNSGDVGGDWRLFRVKR